MTNPAFLDQAASDLEAAALDLARRVQSPIQQLKAAMTSIDRLRATLDALEGENAHLRAQLVMKDEEVMRLGRTVALRDDELLSLKQQLHQAESLSRRAR